MVILSQIHPHFEKYLFPYVLVTLPFDGQAAPAVQPLKCLKPSWAGSLPLSSYRDKRIYIQPLSSREDPCFPSDLRLILLSKYEYSLLDRSFGFCFDFRERRGERERREKGERKTWIGCLLYSFNWGSNPRPRYVP